MEGQRRPFIIFLKEVDMKHPMVLILLLVGTAIVFAQDPGASIRDMTGTVELKASGSANWVPAKAGDRIEKATIISTGFKSMATLAIGSTTLTVRPLTRLSLEELLNQDGAETINIALSSGRVRADVKPPAGSRAEFTVRTPPATASVRGTIFDLDYNSIWVLEGTVGYAGNFGNGRPVQVSAGQSTTVTESGSAMQPLVKADMDRRLPALIGGGAASPLIPWYTPYDVPDTPFRDDGEYNFDPTITANPHGNIIDITINANPK